MRGQVSGWHVTGLDWTLFCEPTVVARPILRGILVNGAGAFYVIKYHMRVDTGPVIIELS